MFNRKSKTATQNRLRQRCAPSSAVPCIAVTCILTSSIATHTPISTHRPAPYPARKAMSLIEVLISMFVLLFGLMGVAAIIPVGNYYVVEGEKFDLGAGLAQNAFEELKSRGMLKPEYWHYADPNLTLAAYTTTGIDPLGGEYDTLVMQSDTLMGTPNLNARTFNIEGSIGSGHAFVLDPLGAADNISLDDVDIFPRMADVNDIDGDGDVDEILNINNPWGALSGTRWPVRRITLRDANNLMSKAVAETIFRLRDDLSVEYPDQSDQPSVQRWDLVDLNTSPTLDDPTDDTLLRRQYKGDYSWLATIVPTTQADRLALQPANNSSGNLHYDVSIVVFRKRVETPNAENERLIHAELLPGGELVVYSNETDDSIAKDLVDAALDDIRPGNWISLMGVNPTTSDFIMKWYRILSLDRDKNSTEEILLGDGTPVQGRRLMLIGPDWPQTPESTSPTGFLNYIPDLRAGLFPNAISVVTKPLLMEKESLWSLE